MPAFSVSDDLSWNVEQRPLFYASATGELTRFEGRVAIVRDDNEVALGIVSEGYETVQNSDLKNMVAPLVEEGLLTIENMGHLSGGAKVFIQAKVNQEFQVIGESYKSYITLLNGHTGNASVAIGPSTVRVICGNTFAMSYSQIGEKFRHSEGVNERILDSTAISEYMNSAMLKYSENVETLASARCTEGQFRSFLEQTYEREFAKIRNVETLNQLFYAGTGTEGHSFYDAFNSVTEFSSNRSRKTPEGRFYYANFGQGNSLNRRAMAVALDLAAV
jgi:phage/plasmid-like protein (TIGR03299 family)